MLGELLDVFLKFLGLDYSEGRKTTRADVNTIVLLVLCFIPVFVMYANRHWFDVEHLAILVVAVSVLALGAGVGVVFWLNNAGLFYNRAVSEVLMLVVLLSLFFGAGLLAANYYYVPASA
jgi:hypothetical protein